MKRLMKFVCGHVISRPTPAPSPRETGGSGETGRSATVS